MGTNIKRNIAIELIKGSLSNSTAAAVSGLDLKSIQQIEKKFKNNTWLAFVAPLLNIAVSSLASTGRGLKFVQVGANDGISGDPVHHLIHKYAEQVLLIEPVPQLIDSLKKSYEDFNGTINIENAAIGLTNGNFKLYMLDEMYWKEYIQKWKSHPTIISSFDKAPLIKKISVRLNISLEEATKRITLLEAPMFTLEFLISKYSFDTIDVLQIDAEGFDISIIKSLGLVRPHIINFESFNLSAKDWEEWKVWANENMYGWIQGPQDTLAIKNANYKIEF